MNNLNGGQPEFKTCPNCGGDGFENTPPMRKCGICKGRGRLPSEGTTPNRREGKKWSHGANAGRKNPICSANQRAS